MTGSIKQTAVEALAANVLDTQFEDIDKTTIETAKYRIIDVIGCAIGGIKASGNQAVLDLAKDWGGKHEATVWIDGARVPAHNAAFANSILCRSFDFEPMMGEVAGRKLCSHISGTTVPAALAMGETVGVNGKELLTTLLVGDDVANRIYLGHNFDFFHGWDGIGTLAIFGATASAGRLLGLDRVQMKHAFGLALNLTAGAIQSIWDGATAFKLPQGAAASNGILSARLAQGGWTGVDDALQSRFGYYTLYTHGCTHPEFITQDLGKVYYAENSFKPYSCCRATHMMIDAALALASKNNLDPDNISEIVIRGSGRSLSNFVGKPFQIRSFPHCDAIFSLRFTCATALSKRSVQPRHFTDTAIHDSRLHALIEKTRLEELPASRGTGIEVRVKTKDGFEYSEYNDIAKGDPISKPLSQDEIIKKFWDQVDFSNTVSKEKAGKLLEEIHNLEKANNIRSLFQLLVA